MEKQIQEVLGEADKAIERLDGMRQFWPGGFEEVVSGLKKMREEAKGEWERRMLERAREETSLQYQWSWWAYPTKRDKLPYMLSCSPEWHDYMIDAVHTACKDPCLKRSRRVFYVCLMRTRSSVPDAAGPLCLYECTAPWKGGALIPEIGERLHPVAGGDTAKVSDAIYEARDKMKDQSEGIRFILLENRF